MSVAEGGDLGGGGAVVLVGDDHATDDRGDHHHGGGREQRARTWRASGAGPRPVSTAGASVGVSSDATRSCTARAAERARASKSFTMPPRRRG